MFAFLLAYLPSARYGRRAGVPIFLPCLPARQVWFKFFLNLMTLKLEKLSRFQDNHSHPRPT
jgi:hypothetical protein